MLGYWNQERGVGEFISNILEAFGKIKAEIDKKGGEFDFRYSLADYLLKEVLGWTRDEGKGHFKIERERKDVICYDDSAPPLPVLIVETVSPNEESASHIGKLEGYLKEIGRVRYGILTNGRNLSVYEYERDKKGERIKKRLELNVDEIVHKDIADLTDEEKRDIFQLRIFVKDRFVKFGDVDYFKTYRNDIPLNYKLGYDLFIEGLRKSLEELNGVFTQFFGAYEKKAHISEKRLREAFENWKQTRVGGEAEPKETFCKETAYILLNRILFTRICEDKGYIPRKISREALAVFYEDHRGLPTPYLKALEDAFEIAEREYERIYQVKIFDWWRMEKAEKYTLNGEEKNKQEDLERELNYTIRNVLKRFTHFDFKTVNSDILGHVYEDYLSKEERKKLGEYYTPPEVVRYILDSVGYTPEEDIEGKKLLDPACGSGTFLVEATKRLVGRYLSKIHKRWAIGLAPEEASMVLESIRDSIYGLDINVFACHIAEMNLFFQTIDLYENIKTKYPEETFKGFNVFCTDSLLPAERKLEDFIDARVKPFLNDQKRIAGIKDMKFDFVIGNPPYVRVQRLEKEQKEHYERYYQTPKANYDIYIIFIERGVKWLENNGKLGYITSDQYALTNYGEKLRKFIAENYKIEQFIDFADTGVFRDVTNYPSIIVIKKTDSEKDIKSNFVKCVRVRQPRDDLLKDIQRNFYKKEYFNEYYDLFEFPQADLSDIWNFMPQKEERVFKKIEENADCKFKEICERIFQGLVSSADAVYLVKLIEKINGTFAKIKPIKSEQEYVIENEILKPLLKGEDVRRWNIVWKDLWVLFPYKIVSGDAILYSEDEMKSDFPKTWQYFLDHEKVLKGREGGKLKNKKDWYAYGRKQNLHRFEQKKILVQVLANRNSFTLDRDGIYYFMGAGGSNAYGILLIDEYDTAEDYLYFLGLLNSSVLEFYIKEISPLYSGKYYIYNRQYLEKLPIKIPRTAEKEDIDCEVVSMVERILKLHKELRKLGDRISGFSDSYITGKLYPLLNVMEGQELSRESYSSSRLRIEVEDVEGKTIYKILLVKKDYIAFKAESSARFLLEVLKRKKRIIKNDLLRMQVPSDTDAERIMREYEDDLERIEGLKREIADLDKSIDEQVYELYGLDEGDRKVIESYI